MESYYVRSRDGARRPVRFDAITDRNEALCSAAYGESLDYVRPRLPLVTKEVIEKFRNGMTTHELDLLTVFVCTARSTRHPDYGRLAARIVVSDLQKTTSPCFVETVRRLGGRLSGEFRGIVERAGPEINRRIRPARDFRFTLFGIQTMIRSYLLRAGGAGTPTVERPQHAYMRVALAIHVGRPDGGGHRAPEGEFGERLEKAFALYDLLSTHRLTHASPTMFNAGSHHPQLSSCFLITVDDNLEVILQAAKDAMMISKWAGGLGISLTRMRAEGALIASTGGRCGGLQRYLALLNAGQLYVDQGGLRPGAYALYLEPWHADVFTFLQMGRFKGRAVNAPDLKYALWVNDLFMEAVVEELEVARAAAAGEAVEPARAAAAGDWHLFSPDEAPGLVEACGEEFRALYRRYVAEKRHRRVVKASAVMTEWFKTVAEKGNPYVLFKDQINRVSNLGHVRTIAGSNLCAEITIPSWFDEGEPDKAQYGTCNLAALPLASFVVPDARAPGPKKVRMDWAALAAAAAAAVENLDNIIDINYYEVAACRRSNLAHRPVAVGVIGLADVLALFGYPFGAREARALDRAIHAVIYHAAMGASAELGRRRGSFSSFPGSAAQRGLLQPDLWVASGHLEPGWAAAVAETTRGFLAEEAWAPLRAACRAHLRNGYVTADMPTATSSQATGQNECVEPPTSNMYPRKTLAGEFVVYNTHLLRELEALGLWDEEMRLALLASGGSVQGIDRVPEDIRRRFRTARELDQRLLTLHAKARNPFLSQTQSLNYYFGEPKLADALTVIVDGWKAGLTTGSYYIHTQPAVGARRVGRSAAAKKAPGGEVGVVPPPLPGGGPAGLVCSACSV